ncbi:MAG: ANTAR domain-containing protein [Lapillicoccus sp.]
MTTYEPQEAREPGPASVPALPADGQLPIEAAMDIIQQLDTEVRNLKAALESNRRIGMAMGIVMKQLGVGPDAAFDALRHLSQNTNRRVADLADDIIYQGSFDL